MDETDLDTRAHERARKLQAFKDWVHNYLDARGVPHHPPGTHGEYGCRIGDRMDWLMERLARAESQLAAHHVAGKVTDAALDAAERLSAIVTGVRTLAAQAQREGLPLDAQRVLQLCEGVTQ